MSRFGKQEAPSATSEGRVGLSAVGWSSSHGVRTPIVFELVVNQARVDIQLKPSNPLPSADRTEVYAKGRIGANGETVSDWDR